MIITLSGIDGSGKTTYAGFVIDCFRDKGIECRYRHTARDSFSHLILHYVIGRVSKSSRRSMEDGLRNRKNKPYFLILAFIKKILLLVNLVYFNLRYRRYKADRTRNIVCDRYFYDEIVQMLYLKIAGEAFVSFYRGLVIKPDIAFFIKVEPEVANSRKNEFDKDYFLKKSKLYEQMASAAEATDIPDNTKENSKALIFKELNQRLSTI